MEPPVRMTLENIISVGVTKSPIVLINQKGM
jgi:hypothetical protein